ncbi:hypothetical protein [Pseudoalteromonas denitrificans]|uniref:Uncharacterized protein n=1 Tax=Pseudoalteromonas denitrificans DSM 6059 TaxID=1123010 RepID=A0A1I1FPZ1_9GAMM|nr:hypothetical protein [Pseudoalteromonas denitrificans]SFC01517.1 hypothetical protein SAMN02745724_00724 [Pseudoalteromonas denitrificans DSM 6059]
MKMHSLVAKKLFFVFCLLMLMPGSVMGKVIETKNVSEVSTPTLVIDDIRCNGNETTECSFVTKKYYQQIGDILDTDEIADAKLRLGTLFQFKSVDIYLEKGGQRGHVVVVFDITEASNIQYDLGAGYQYAEQNSEKSREQYCYSDLGSESSSCFFVTTNIKQSDYQINAKITDFNFLGNGKELSFMFFGKRGNSEVKASPADSFMNNSFYLKNISEPSKSDNDNYDFSLHYYDPHLFDSSRYYLSANIRESKYTHKQKNNKLYSNGIYAFSISTPTKYKLTNIDFSLGRRFASHSYISLDVSRKSNPFGSAHKIYSMSYGWNTEDDALFPTQGEIFSSSITSTETREEGSVYYKYNFDLAENKIFSLGSSVIYTQSKHSSNNYGYGGELSARFTHISSIDKINGRYSGWYIGTKIGNTIWPNHDANSLILNVNAGYTHQTDNMIYRFTLGYDKQEYK